MRRDQQRARSTGPTPKRRTDGSASARPRTSRTRRAPATTPIAAGSRPRSSVTNSSVRRPEHAPHDVRGGHRAPASAAQDRRSRTIAEPARISPTTGSRSSAGGGPAPVAGSSPSSSAETTNDTASMAIARGALSSWTRKPLIPNADELGDRRAGGEGAVRRDQLVRLDDGRQVGPVGDVEERRQAGGEERHEIRAGRGRGPPADRRDRDRGQQHGSAEIRGDHDRTRRSRSTQAPATRPTSSPGTRSRVRRMATSIGPASRTRIATNGSAIRVTSEPKIEIVPASQSADEDAVAPD